MLYSGHLSDGLRTTSKPEIVAWRSESIAPFIIVRW